MTKARLLPAPLIMILFWLALGCSQRVPARSQANQAPDGLTPSAVAEIKDTRPVGAETAKIGEPIQLADIIFVVNGFGTVVADVITVPRPGHKFLAVEVSITNTGKTTRYYSSVRDLYLRDSRGRKYTNEATRPVESIDFLDDGASKPGQTIRGEVNFEVPENEHDFTLYFDPVTAELQELAMVRLVQGAAWTPAGSEIPPNQVFDMPGPKHEQE